MIRYVSRIVDGKPVRYVMHAFVAENAIIEDIDTGQVLVVPATELRFDPPSEHMFMQAQRAQAAGSPPPMMPMRTVGPGR